MAWTITTCGRENASAGTTVVVSAASPQDADVPAGSLILVAVHDHSASGTGSVADSAGNVYTGATPIPLNNSAANGFVQWFYSYTGNALPLTSGGALLTYTKGAIATASVVCAYASGFGVGSAIDTAVTSSGFGNGSSVSVTSGTPSQTGDLFVAAFGNNNTNAFTQDTGNGWASTPPAQTSANSRIFGASQVNAGAGTIVFAPTIATSTGLWAVSLIGFNFSAAAGFFSRYYYDMGTGPG